MTLFVDQLVRGDPSNFVGHALQLLDYGSWPDYYYRDFLFVSLRASTATAHDYDF